MNKMFRPLVTLSSSLALTLALPACHRPSTQTRQESPDSSTAASSGSTVQTEVKLDACSLLTKEEFAAVQGCALTGARGGDDAAGKFRVSQCVYTAEEASNSVSLVLMGNKSGGADAPTIKQFWHKTFGRFAVEKKDEDDNGKPAETRGGAVESRGKDEKEEEEGKPPPFAIHNLGDGAYWASSHVGGTMYILKGDTLVRISVGGPGADAERMEKARQLAAKALTRL